MCTIAATDLNLWCFNTVVWATNVYQFVRLFLFFLYQTVTKLQPLWIPNTFDVSRKYKPSVLQKRPLHSIPVGVHKCNLSWKTRIRTVTGLGRPYHLYPKASFRYGLAERISRSYCSLILTRYGDAAISTVI